MIERQPDQTPVRIVEAEWENDRIRYVNALEAMTPASQISFLSFYFITAKAFYYGDWGVGLLLIALSVAIQGWPAVRRARAYRFIRAQYRPIDPGRPGEVGLVQISLRTATGEYAADVGFLTMDDGAITFEGGQVSFSLEPNRWSAPPRTLGLWLSSPDWPGRSLVVKAIPRRRALRDLALPDDDAIRHAFEGLAPESARVEVAQTPPRRPAPDRRRGISGRRWKLMGQAFAVATLVMIVVAIVAHQAFSVVTLILIVCAAGAFVCLDLARAAIAREEARQALEHDP